MPHKFILDSEGTAGSCSALGSLVENPNSVQFRSTVPYVVSGKDAKRQMFPVDEGQITSLPPF